MAGKLTDSAIAKATRSAAEKGARRDLSDGGCPGLRLRLTPSGARSWVLACRDRSGRMRRFPLGSFPAVGISEARDAARALHVKVRQDGADPVAERRVERAKAQSARDGMDTLGALIGLYGEKNGRNLKSWPECERRIKSVFARQLVRPLSALTRAELQLAADAWKAQQSAAAAVRYLRPVLKWAAQRGYVAQEVASVVPPATVGRRDRVLSREELARLLPALSDSDRPYAACMRFLLLTLARREEGCAATWRDVNLVAGTWTIATTKNGQSHIVPLSRQAADVLRSRRPSDATADALIFATGTGERLANWDRETKRLMQASGTKGWTRHDLRRTGATMLGDMGELPDIIEAALNHVSIRSPIAAVYNRSRYRPQVALALQRLADALDGIEQGAATVVPIFRSDCSEAERPSAA